MVELSFGITDVEKWAQFSHDYNPIHFDIAHAKMAGLDTLIVHGMLALLPVKQAVSEESEASKPSHAGWTRFRALFRAPIPHDRAHALELRHCERGIDFRFRSAVIGNEHFRGSYGTMEEPCFGAGEPWMESKLSSEHLEEQINQFSNYYPFITERWVALDAIVFSEFIRTNLEAIEKKAQSQLPIRFGSDVDDKILVQVSHTVSVAPELIGKDVAGIREFVGLAYTLGMPELIASTEQTVGTVTLTVTLDRRVIMLVELGLMMKSVDGHTRQ